MKERIGLAGLVVGTFLLRVLPSWDKVFIDGNVWYRGVDPWYHMRLVDNIMENFPIPLKWDMFALYPNGMAVGYFPLISLIIALPGQVFNYEVIGALLPPILGALTLIPIYLICKTLWKSWIGLIACGLVMILPTEFFHRSMLGFTDHHILEVFFSVNTILFLILMHKEGKLRWAILAGVSLGLYMSSWSGGLLLVAPIWIWFFIIFIYKLKNNQPIDVFVGNMCITFSTALILYLPNCLFIKGIEFQVLTMGIVVASFWILHELTKVLGWRKLIGLVGLAVGVICFFIPGLTSVTRSVLFNFDITIQEALLSGPKVLLAQYGTSFFLSIGGLAFAIKRKENLLLIVWCTFMLILAINQRRWNYYFAINNAIMAAYFIYVMGSWIKENARIPATVVICSFLLFTILPSTIAISNLPNTITKDWYAACVWLEKNTPEMDGYYELNSDKLDYGVLSWWDYGNWITRISKRAPVSNPMVHQDIQWEVLTAKSEEEANTYLEGINYIVVDRDMVSSKFPAILNLSPRKVDYIPFVFTLWNEETDTWIKIHQEGEVKIYGRK